MKKKKVLQLIDSLNVGGAEMLLIDLIHGLLKNDYEVIVGYSTPGPLENTLRGMNLIPVKLPRFFRVDIFLFLSILFLILREKPDIVHTHLFKSDFHGRIAARLCGVPLIVSTIHNNDAWIRKFPLGMIYGWTSNLANGIIAVSEEVAVFHNRYAHTDLKKINVISNGVDVKRFTGAKVDSEKIRREYFVDQSAPLLGIIGRLEPQKDHINFLNAAALITKEIPEARFLIVGDGSLRESLASQAKGINLLDRVIFTGIRQDIPDILTAIDLLVISSKWEGLPVTLLEAMSAHCPVVATNVGGISDVVESEKSALLVPSEDPVSLAKACLRILKDKELARRLANTAFDRVRAGFSVDVMIEKTITLYRLLWEKHAKNQSS